MRILHLSDPHFGTEQAPVVSALLATSTALSPDLIVISGDITQRAHRHQFKQAAQFIAQLPHVPMLVVPGNHDISLLNVPQRLLRPYQYFRQYISQHTESVVSRGAIELIGFNSTSRWRHKKGELDCQRIAEYLDRLPAKTAGHLRVCSFHHPLTYQHAGTEQDTLGKSAEVAATLARFQVDLVLNGHLHDPYILPSQQVFADLPYHMILAQAGTCTSHRLRRGIPNSFNVYDYETGILHCQRWDYHAQAQQFALHSQHHYPLTPHQGVVVEP